MIVYRIPTPCTHFLMADNNTIDNLVNDVYGADANGAAPAYVTKRKTITQSFQLRTWDLDDVAIERILDAWAEGKQKTANIKKSIALYHAVQRGDIQYIEDNHRALVQEIQLADRVEMQQQIDTLTEQVRLLTAQVNQHEETINKNIVPGLRWIVQRIGAMQVIKNKPQALKLKGRADGDTGK